MMAQSGMPWSLEDFNFCRPPAFGPQVFKLCRVLAFGPVKGYPHIFGSNRVISSRPVSDLSTPVMSTRNCPKMKPWRAMSVGIAKRNVTENIGGCYQRVKLPPAHAYTGALCKPPEQKKSTIENFIAMIHFEEAQKTRISQP